MYSIQALTGSVCINYVIGNDVRTHVESDASLKQKRGCPVWLYGINVKTGINFAEKKIKRKRAIFYSSPELHHRARDEGGNNLSCTLS